MLSSDDNDILCNSIANGITSITDVTEQNSTVKNQERGFGASLLIIRKTHVMLSASAIQDG
jgi:hypothetical protein